MLRRAVLVVVLVGAALLLPSAAAMHPAASDPPLSRLAPPRDGQAYIGLTFPLFDTNEPVWGDNRPFSERIEDSIEVELAGKTPAFIKVWTPWQLADLPQQPLVPFSAAIGDIARVRGVVGSQGLMFLDWNLTQTTVWNDGVTVRDIARGTLDRYIRAYARDVRAYGLPVQVLLFNGEFNGDWWYGVSPRANPFLSTDDFVKAWRRVVDIFRAVGASNVSWAWVVNGYPANTPLPGIDSDIGAYYPGDEYVDWIGADVYDVGTPEWLDGPYAFAVAHSKPMWIGEFGIRHEWSALTPVQQRGWLEAMFDYFESHQAVKAVSYFNFNNRQGATHVHWDPRRDVLIYGGHVRYTPDLNDHDSRLLAGGPAIRAIFARRIASARYLSTVSTETVESKPLAPTAEVLAPTFRGSVATIRWRGNLAADRYDLGIKRGARPWRVVAGRLTSTSHRRAGVPGERIRVRIRPRDVFGSAGSWSSSRLLVYPRR